MRYFAFVLLFFPCIAIAQVYRCEAPDGRAVFSQTPCAHDAQKVEVRAIAPDAANRARMDEQTRQTAASTRHQVEIHRLEREARRLELERDRAVAELDARRSRAANNLAGATWLQSLAQERQAVYAHYDPQIQATRSEIARLRAEGPQVR